MTNFNENSKYELSQKSTQLELTPFHADGFSEASVTLQKCFRKIEQLTAKHRNGLYQ
jgi:hypothetical protein